MGLYSGGLIIGRIFASAIWELIFGRDYFGGSLLSEFYGICSEGLSRVNMKEHSLFIVVVIIRRLVISGSPIIMNSPTKRG